MMIIPQSRLVILAKGNQMKLDFMNEKIIKKYCNLDIYDYNSMLLQ